MKRVLAFDFGASSGRAILAEYENGHLTYKEAHRFENCPRERDGHFRWDFADLMANVHQGIEKAGAFDSIGFDTWGVDFVLLDENGKLLGDPVHYRDSRTEGMVEKAMARMDADALYTATASQIMAINTLFQLLAVQEQDAETWEKARRLLFMPDLFAHALCGANVCETTIASTSQMLDARTGAWNRDVLQSFAIPEHLFAPRVNSGTVVGEYQGAKVIAVAGHDTQCAVAAMPASDANAAFLSCGTWSLLGCELDAPVLTEQSRLLALSNEQGANGKVNYLKNIVGLWLIQESRRQWRREGQEYSYAQLEQLALAAEPLRSFIDPDDPLFTPPGDIPGRVREFCRRTGQPVPETVGQVMRCIYESLALKYRFALEQLSRATGKQFSVLHVLGGGAKDGLLCRMTADCAGIPVIAGPVEATALGNILIQLVALGELPDIAAGRALIAATEPVKRFAPADRNDWDKAYETYITILSV
ncbi:rhamnulokinase [Gemmiger formicilis]|uniref:rhamnulokinase n=1 Tax=Gemmiger formicilis TaxID=745368 RepID=UPI00195DADE9|nr:rhamnulokinase family protein [Gemmiger formicilis]MBM6915385.1 rhamnulokinase [Gemmiger formicilis]